MRLPTVKRPRYDAEAHAGPDDGSGVPEDVPLASALTVDLIAELVEQIDPGTLDLGRAG